MRFCVVWEDGVEELMDHAEVEVLVDAARAAATPADEGSGLVTLPQPAYENSLFPLSGDLLGLEATTGRNTELLGQLLARAFRLRETVLKLRVGELCRAVARVARATLVGWRAASRWRFNRRRMAAA